MSNFDFDIQSAVKHALQDMGFEKPTEIQAKAIPLILEGKDVIGKSQTGSGKTVAFGIPAIEQVDAQANKKNTQILIICPTRELAIQATGELRKLTKYTRGIKTLAVYGGQPIGRQIPLLRQGAQIVVGTPGRIMDHIRRKTIKLSSLKMVVLDEADEMLNMGFREDIETILKEVPEERQTVLFSATMPKAIMDIVNNFQKDPVTVEVKAVQMTVDTIKQYFIDCPKGRKVDVMEALIKEYNLETSIVFCNTKKMVDELTELMQDQGIPAKGLHGDMRQRERDNVMHAFRKGTAKMLIATDVAARGIDVDNVQAVINFDMPTQTEYYVHRIGRTGRAGREGLSFTLAQGRRQSIMIKDIIRSTKTDILPLKAPDMDGEGGFTPLKMENVLGSEQGRERRNDRYSQGGRRNEKRSWGDNKDRGGRGDRNDRGERADRGERSDRGERAERPRQRQRSESNEEMYTMRLTTGKNSGATPGNILGAVAGESGIKGSKIGGISIKDKYSLVEVPMAQKDHIINSLNGAYIGGKKIQAQ